MWLFVAYHVLSASQNCQNGLAVLSSISILGKAVNLIDLAFNANNAVPMYDIKISTGFCPLFAQCNSLLEQITLLRGSIRPEDSRSF
jgi:hypothetical protein